MARYEVLDSNMAPLGEGPGASDMLFELGMMYSVGRMRRSISSLRINGSISRR